MAGLVFVVLLLAIAGHSSGATWCVCKEGNDAALQKTLDYACGAGADCTLIHQNGACYNPNTLRAHCNYAVNSYFQKKGQAQGSCDFAGTATVTASDPSTAGCVYPTSASSTPVTTTPTTTPTTPTTTPTTPSTMPTTPSTTPTTTTPSTTTPIGGSPYVTTPSTGVLGGVNNGLGPSGVGINTDMSHGGLILEKTSLFSFLMTLLFSGIMFLWG
uniref:Putative PLASMODESMATA CALLOSE-BINDING PROTEIN 3 n=1 Tax=Davidia involucrata TaxID=16924 RepID=A0A5B7BJW8_DAVIN